MSPPDLTVEFTNMRDYPKHERDGSVTVQKRVEFYIGKYGPFVEYFPLDGFSQMVVDERVRQLKRELEGLTRG